ncbi:uncharacterized protein [Primulina huaijiensis]|uniref:uncharacterized protein isoform X2 n=1 Tax=Primulina huaijiensis TaxID=1492673 RepID=UPI003CC77B68
MEGMGVRRRMVQSTLFPHKESSVKEAENCDLIQIEVGNGNKEEEVKEEEECGSIEKRRKTKRKPNSETKTTPPGSSTKVKNISQESSSKQVDFDDSPITIKSSFFVKASERGQNKKQRNQLVHVDSPEKIDELCSPSISVANGKSTPQKPKRQHNASPKEEKMNSTPSKKTKNGSRKSCSTEIAFELTLDEQQLPTIPNLRLEAKLTAEENSRIFAGKQVHPFFTSWKSGKNNQDLTGSDSKWSFFEKKEKGVIFNPIHVFENVEEDHIKLDWGHLIFPETSVSDTLYYQCSPVYEGSVESLSFDNYLSGSRFTRTSLHPNSHQSSIQLKEVSIWSLDQLECLHPITSSLLAGNRLLCDAYPKDVDMIRYNKEEILASSVQIAVDLTLESNDLFAGNSSCGNLDSNLQERIMSNYNTSHNQHENCLWTDKYRPQNAKQICGNGQSVKFLSEWLQLWQKKGSPASRGCIDEDKCLTQDDGHYCLRSDCDSDTTDGDDSLKNVLLVTGPFGSGKSAAIYACAREHGFQIIEINASDWRNGALVKQKFGEAVESHWLQRTSGNPINSDKSLSMFFSPVNTKTHCPDMEVLEMIPLLDKEDSQNADALSDKITSGDNLADKCQNGNKTLILFEDVDATLCEDHGFISTIQQLAETAKRPMILTSNSKNPVLPKSLDRSELSFFLPSLKDLLGHVSVICAAENIKIHPFLVERFVDHCQKDIRKTIMLLQFWWCGQSTKRGNKLYTTYNPVPFDLDAGHHILPKMIPWGYFSQLSEFVFKEVVNSLVLTEEIPINCEELSDSIAENIHRQNDELDPFVAKKKAMLRLHTSHQDEAEYTAFDANLELFDSSCSPIAFGRPRRRRKTNTVLSSDSEDEFLGGSTLLDSGGLLDVDVKMLASHCLTTQIGPLPTELIYSSAVDKLEEHCFQLSEGVDYSCMDYICKSPDISCVPESSYVPETELIHDTDLYSTTVSYGHFANATAANSFVQDSLPVLEATVGAYYNESFHAIPTDQEMFGNHSETGVAFVYQEEVGESLSKCEADVPREYQVLDECSCVDFASRLKSFDNQHKTDNVFDSVQESWNRLRSQCKDLRNYVTTEEKSYWQILKLSHGITDVISNTDLLLNDCHTLLYDSLRPLMSPCEKTHSYSFHDDQLKMSSILAQHGMCFYAKEIASLGSITGSAISLDLTTEMLSSSVSSIALGKLSSLERKMVEISDTKTSKSSNLLTCKSDPHICNIFESVVPSRSYLAVKGEPFHEYLSTLSQISRFETSRLSESVGNNKRRRARVPRHYLTSGSSTMSLEEISSLEQYNAYKLDASLGYENFR